MGASTDFEAPPRFPSPLIFLPCPCSLPRYRGGSASASLLSRPLKLHTRYFDRLLKRVSAMPEVDQASL